MKSELNTQIRRLSRQWIQAMAECEHLQGEERIQAEKNCKQIEEEMDELQERLDQELLKTLKKILNGHKTYEEVMTFLKGEPYRSKAGEFVYVRPDNQLVYVRKCFEKKRRLLEEKFEENESERYETGREIVSLIRESDWLRNHVLMELKTSNRTYAEIAGYVRRRK